MIDYYNIHIMSADIRTPFNIEYNERFDAIIQLITVLTLPRKIKMAAATTGNEFSNRHNLELS